jgi:hypothetical protein
MCDAFWRSFEIASQRRGHYESTNAGYNAMLEVAPLPPSPAPDVSKTRNELLEMGLWEEGWGGNDETRVNPSAIRQALDFIAMLPAGARPPCPGASSIGNVGLWWRGEGLYLSVDFDGSDTWVYYGKTPSTEMGAELPIATEALPDDLLAMLPMEPAKINRLTEEETFKAAAAVVAIMDAQPVPDAHCMYHPEQGLISIDQKDV